MSEIGQTIAHYRILEKIGVGGMGKVYLAEDLSLDREVALKFLPDAFAGDPERMARFEREAKLLASLNHPNIAAIYGLEEADGKRFLVLEYVEGETLQARVSKGALPVEGALGVCRQIEEGLEAAHEKGVIRRDLKPANVMVTSEEKVKILDFGLAKALSDETQSVDSSQSPTLTEAMTRPGVILGTAAYMSPEQAKCKAVDKRADIWAFGCILYECLTGKRAFEGETVTETLAAILKGEPEYQALPAATPPNIRFVLRRCLEKGLSRRFRDAADVRIEIEEARDIGVVMAPAKRRWLWLAWGVAAILIVAFAAVSFVHFREHPPAPAEPVRFQIALPDKVRLDVGGSLALSPDGRRLAFAAAGSDSVVRVWVRVMDSLETRPLAGTESPHIPPFFWSPDSRFIAFDAGGKLKKVDVIGGPPQTLCDVSTEVLGGSWNRDRVIIFGTGRGNVMRVSAAGGTASPVTKLNAERGEYSHYLPTFLPDGRHFLYWRASTKLMGVYVGSLDSKPEEQSSKRILAASGANIMYLPSQGTGPGQLLFLREQTLVAQRFDDKRLELVGEPVPVAEQVGSYSSYAFFSISTNGILVYSRAGGDSQITWVDRAGRQLGRIGEPGNYPTFDLSKDASRLVVSKVDGHQNLWIIDLLRGSTTRLTLEEAGHVDPRWSPDGRQVIFASTRDSSRSPFRVSLPASSPEQVFKFEGKQFALDDWSPDGQHLLYHDTGKPELWVLPLTGDRKPMLVTRSLSGFVDQAQFSPDGCWIAFNTNESGRHEVMVVPFPPTSDKWQISTAGGVQPTWRGDGRELYFLSPDGTLTAVDVRGGKTFEWGEGRPLFKTQLSVSDEMEQYAPAPDGNRFLFVLPASEASTAPFNVILNWTALLKK